MTKTIPDLYQRTLSQLGYGDTTAELSEALQEAVQRAQDTGKQAKLQLTMTIKPVGGRAGQVEITESIKSSLPELDRGKTLMFTTPEGNLQRDNPTKPDLDGLREVGDRRGTLAAG